MLRTIAIAVLTVALYCLGAAGAVAQQQLDPETQRQVSSAILQQLEPYALYSNGRFYTNFQISGQAQAAPQGGFAAPLTPQGAPIVGAGVMEITPQYPWSFSFFPDAAGGSRGVVSVRLMQYRVYDGRGWSYPKLLMIHFWEWNVRVGADGPQVAVKMDGTSFPTDNGARELVASVYNVAPSNVSVAATDPSLLGQILSGGPRPAGGAAPAGGCRPCERQAADGTCHQWRACM
jgi:hypothetical protein